MRIGRTPTMSLRIEAKLLAKARAAGTTPEEIVRQAIEPILASAPERAPQPHTPKKSLLGAWWAQYGPKPCGDVFDLWSRRYHLIAAVADTHAAVWYLDSSTECR